MKRESEIPKSEMEKLVKKLKNRRWRMSWAGNWGLLACSDFGEFYNTVKILDKTLLSIVVFLFKDGRVACWMPEKEWDDFAKQITQYVGQSQTKAHTIADDLVIATDKTLKFLKENQKRISFEIYEKYLKTVRDYYIHHIKIKYIADALDEQLAKKFLPIFQKARLYSEPVFDRTLEFDKALAQAVHKKTGRPVAYVLFMTKEELKNFFKTDKAPAAKVLQARRKYSVLVYENGKPFLFVGNQAKAIEQAVLSIKNQSLIKGTPAFPGKVQGKARIVYDPNDSHDFQAGDILIAPITRPDYLPLMKKAGAFVTDAGGILSHAAITAREMKKPCIIGTKTATKVLKDGDMVEVDADNGIVKVIK